jgi:hypothetical protein
MKAEGGAEGVGTQVRLHCIAFLLKMFLKCFQPTFFPSGT